jgi:hypothetical protein
MLSLCFFKITGRSGLSEHWCLRIGHGELQQPQPPSIMKTLEQESSFNQDLLLRSCTTIYSGED